MTEPDPELYVRRARPQDSDAFICLARLYAHEAGKEFDENHAHFLFAGVARQDPMIYVLEINREIVGFSFVRVVHALLVAAQCVKQELVFVRADKRTVENELALHRTTILEFAATDASEIELAAPASPHALEVIEQLRTFGLRDAALRMTAVRADKQQDIASGLGSVSTALDEDARATATKH